MTDPNYTHLTVIADASGSMNDTTDPGRTKASDATAGIRKMLADQSALPGKLTVSVVQFTSGFNGQIELRKDLWFESGTAAAAWGGIAAAGGTPLLDALGAVITETGTKLEEMPEGERPGKVAVVIATDGEENLSREYRRDTIRDMIARQRDEFGWEFVFIGAGFDAFSEAGGIGVAANSTMSAGAGSFAAAYDATSDNLSAYRTRGAMPAFSSKQRDDASGTGAGH